MDKKYYYHILKTWFGGQPTAKIESYIDYEGQFKLI